MIFSEHSKPKSFRVRALAFLVPVVILESVVAVLLADYVARKGLNERIEASLTEDAKLRSITVSRALDEVEELSRRLAIHPGIRRSLAGRDRLTTFLMLTENVRGFPIGTRLAAIDMRGTLVGEAARVIGAPAVPSRRSAEEGIPVVKQEQVFVKEGGITYILPILSGGDLVGNLNVEVPWSHVGVGLNLGGPRDYLLVADGKVRIASRQTYAASWETVRRDPSNPAALFHLGPDLAVGHAFRSGDLELEILSVALASEVEIPLAALRRDLELAFGILGLVILAVTVYLTRLLSQPLAEIDAQVQAMARAGVESRRVTEEGTAETASLARSFNEFIGQIQKGRENESRLLQQLALREKMAGLGTLAGGVAHEFNNALGGIVSNVESALHEVTSPSVREDLELVRKVALRASAIAKNLLGFARQTPAGEKTAGNIVEVLEDTLSIVKQIFAADGMNVEKNFEAVPMLKFDRGQMQQVFLNVLTNARQAMRRGDTLTVSVRESRDAAGGGRGARLMGGGKFTEGKRSVEISFADTGVGIPEENLNKIFEPFFTTKGALGGGETPGTGLGLSVSHTIVRSHGGDIAVTSKVGAGTTVSVLMPVDEIAAQAILETPAPKPARKTKVGMLRVLVVDDEDSIRTSLVKTLRRMSHEVDAAPNGHAAARMVETEEYDLVFMDLLMPDMDGFSVYGQIKENVPEDKRPRVVFMTGAPTPQNLEKASSMGALGIMEKPFVTESVTSFIDRALSANV